MFALGDGSRVDRDQGLFAQPLVDSLLEESRNQDLCDFSSWKRRNTQASLSYRSGMVDEKPYETHHPLHSATIRRPVDLPPPEPIRQEMRRETACSRLSVRSGSGLTF
jgi:hypothetical protein